MKKKEERINNQGFSLVELIIVIAIMAILVGIVGTQVIPYIDRAKKAKDIQIVNGYCTDAASAFASCTDQLDSSKTYTITISKESSGWTVDTMDNGGLNCTTLTNAFIELNSIDTKQPNFQSEEGKKITKIVIVCKHGNFAAKLTVVGPDDANAFEIETK